ncbi:hypothetical protein ACJ73_03957 [Blastomyces percursus]|uniref:Uncharacterized protein n=1 Tax=Blastomyces percursus TaxID=1658174 RepID=A0A1J9QWS1_9EURO|nr:hypothetical protein ACJ73_03957 [Blastomyces percursus]
MVPFLCSKLGPSGNFNHRCGTQSSPSTWPLENDFRVEKVSKESFRDALSEAIICSAYGCESCGIVENMKRCAVYKRICGVPRNVGIARRDANLRTSQSTKELVAGHKKSPRITEETTVSRFYVCERANPKCLQKEGRLGASGRGRDPQ